MALKIHCIDAFDGRNGKTTCGQEFFVGRLSCNDPKLFAAQGRIGGLIAYKDSEFWSGFEGRCQLCIERYST